MWEFTQEKIGHEIAKYKIMQSSRIVSYIEAIDLMCTSSQFRTFFNQALKSSPYDAYFWEVRPVTTQAINEEFEFVLVNSAALAKIETNNSSFAEYFKQNRNVVSFFNIGRDAKLVVLVEIGDPAQYAHLATFVRGASLEQVDAFWQKVGEEIRSSIDDSTIWVSTSGLGVHWLHVRIDRRPKYYSYVPYRRQV